MSLNGLDHAKVKEAYETAAGEPGGWFLLKYVSRDEVDVLASGNGGIVEIRNAVAKYEEPSPLYGFLRYRRRNVIVRYMPENCSRLIQARATVHFNAVCERFTPYNTKFEITTAKDLKDSKLSAACSLHAASGSSCSSSSSLRRRRLNEIAEEEEEEERERKRKSIEKVDENGNERPVSSIYSEAPRSPLTSGPPVVLDPQQLTAPQGTKFASTNRVPNFTGADRPVSPAHSDIAGRLSSQSARPGLYASSTFSYSKPKVKLAPRPSVEGKKRPTTSGNFRPIANLPAGFKFFAKSLKKGKLEGLEQVEKSGQNRLAIPQETMENQLPLRPATSSGASMKSITPSMSPSTKESKMTPEKVRLMKAMRMREKKMQGTPLVEVPTSTNTAPTADKGATDTKGLKPALHVERNDSYRSVSNADSGIAVDPPTPITISTEEPSEGTVSDSHPPSPTAASMSEIGDSTKASSLSESTEETIQGTKETGRDTEEEDGPEELSEIVEEAGLRMSVVEGSPGSPSGPTEGPHVETKETDVSDMTVTKAAEESRGIPEPEPSSVQTTEPKVEEPTVAAEKDTSNSSTQEPELEPAVKDQEPPRSPLGVPRSKFSSNEPKSSTSPTTPTLKSKFSSQNLKTRTETVPAVPDKASSVEKSEQSKTEASAPISENKVSVPQRSTRRKVTVDPIKTNLAKGESGNPLLDDDDLMEELQSATLHEAKPIIVSKSPLSPGFPNPTSSLSKEPGRLARTPTSPMHLTPGDVSQNSARSGPSGGAAYLNTLNRQGSTAGMTSKKGNMGSAIQQRIKALEKLSGSTGEEARPRTAIPSSTIFVVRKGSVREPSKPSLADRANSITIQTPTTPDQAHAASPETPANRGRERSSSVAKRLSMFEGQNAPRGRPESIQVTARIIRDANQMLKKSEPPKNLTDSSSVELKQSPLLVDLQTAHPANLTLAREESSVHASPNKNNLEQRGGKSVTEDGEKKARRRSSLSVMKDFIKDRKTSTASKSTDNLAAMSPGASVKSSSRPPSSQQNGDNITRRLSISSYRSSFSRDRDNASTTPLASPSVMSDSGSGDEGDKKSKTRASRFMRRLSNSFGSGRKSVSANISPTVAEEDPDQLATAPAAEKPQASSQPAVITYMGDVNVQFPDNLLWKRRSMCLDSQGFLFLSAVQGAAANVKEKAGVKRYHLSDFRMPFIPDVEVQELPNSVVLELVEGSSLQIACGDRAGQMNVLHTLQDAHQSHASFGQ
ncbi:hypothetical protein F5X99DRAFT_239291 [Biscogniauxia marginata]|nr:hypothetical protein F5X99DRAFT_239291 [Biscogniauxia marginata]